MPWCPNCGSEYEEGVKACCDCRCDLVEELPPNQNPAENGLQPIKEVFLMTVADEMEYLVVESKLKGYGIPVVRRHRQGGDLTASLMGMSRLGLDIFVPEAVLKEARQIVELEMEEQPEFRREEPAYERRKPSFIMVLLVIIAGYALINYISRLN